MSQWKAVWFDLYQDMERLLPVWFEHPEYGPTVDLVAIEVAEMFSETAVIAANDSRLGERANGVGAGTDAFVIGYPVRLYGGAHFPIWKRASIASEPDLDVDRLPKILIDTATRKGMSGSPVFAQISGLILPEGGNPGNPADLAKSWFGTGHNFLGVYSGAFGREPFEAQLGIVWKERAIQETIAGKHIGVSSFELSKRDSPVKRAYSLYDWDDWPLPETVDQSPSNLPDSNGRVE
ncbi:serine protease [Burkholderia contaminans]|uniref:serine protease n=1 Tax=Burkholderia contaminans TaxID=488447 RepID=UPI001CF4ED16|nr:serine protease [Burkholderia contaminans]MCA8101198.1 serine protease [Burkholderia contaminans]